MQVDCDGVENHGGHILILAGNGYLLNSYMSYLVTVRWKSLRVRHIRTSCGPQLLVMTGPSSG